MKSFYLFLGAFTALANAHSEGVQGLPKMMGARKFFSEVKARNYFNMAENLIKNRQVGPLSVNEKRQAGERRCGPGLGSCDECCSAEGYCGSGPEYCISPDCQYQYGPKCDANTRPAGPSTANINRPLVGDVPYGGAGIYDCVTPGTVAFTFDDGPYLYTSDLLDKFKRYNAHATFFITGNNLGKGPIDSTPQWSNIIKRMALEGHQIASHTWTHQSLDKIDGQTFQNQVIYNEMALRNILGYFPTYIRPPYSQCEESPCGAKLKQLGYHVVYFDVDTAGYLNTDVSRIRKSKDIWDATISTGNPATSSFLEIEHDIHFQIVYNLTDHILESIYSHGYRSVTVGECLGDPPANWYRSGCDGNSGQCTLPISGAPITQPQQPPQPPRTNSSSPTPKKSISIDGSCSSSTTCLGSPFGDCCSQHGWCGSSAEYCGNGCNHASGRCNF